MPSPSACAVGRGNNVVLVVRRPGSVADLADAHRDQVLVAELDVRDTGRAGDVVRSAVDRFDRVDVLVNNAGRGVDREPCGLFTFIFGLPL